VAPCQPWHHDRSEFTQRRERRRIALMSTSSMDNSSQNTTTNYIIFLIISFRNYTKGMACRHWQNSCLPLSKRRN
jgi:hypothetical protein